MKDIYSRASDVLVWLGEEDETTEKGYALAKTLAHHPDADPLRKVTCSIPMSGLSFQTAQGCHAWAYPLGTLLTGRRSSGCLPDRSSNRLGSFKRSPLQGFHSLLYAEAI